MIIEQEKEFKPLTIKIETKEEYIALEQIIDEANAIPAKDRAYMESKAAKMGIVISDWFSSNT